MPFTARNFDGAGAQRGDSSATLLSGAQMRATKTMRIATTMATADASSLVVFLTDRSLKIAQLLILEKLVANW
jgi:hypothetical protein